MEIALGAQTSAVVVVVPVVVLKGTPVRLLLKQRKIMLAMTGIHGQARRSYPT